MDRDQLRKFKETISKGPVLGPFSKSSDPGVIETLGYAGFDFVILDMEHGQNDLQTTLHLIRAAEVANIIPIVRVLPEAFEMISKVLDMGAAGVQIPQITRAEEVERAVQMARFGPVGSRGVSPFVRAARYSAIPRKEFYEQANEALVVIQLEGQEALDNLDSILSVEGPDIVFIGPNDLSQSLGVPGEVDHPLVVEKTKEIVEVCIDKGIVVGNFTESAEKAAFWAEQGLRYLAHGTDLGIIYQAQCDYVSRARKECGLGD